MRLLFVETVVFTRRMQSLGLEPELRGLQNLLLLSPEAGALDPGTGGLRKLRLADSARGIGKRGGARLHYLWLPEHSVVYLMFVYTKGEMDTLEPDQKRALRATVEAIKAEWNRRARRGTR